MSDQVTVRVPVLSQEQHAVGPFVFYGPLDEVIASLVAIRDSIVDIEGRQTAFCEISSMGYEEDHYAAVDIWYTRPETSEGAAVRAAKAEAELRHAHDQERATYLRLRQKFDLGK